MTVGMATLALFPGPENEAIATLRDEYSQILGGVPTNQALVR